MKRLWRFALAVITLIAGLIIWASYLTVENSQEKDKMTNDITTETYKVNYDDKSLYGVMTAPKDYQFKKLPTIIMAHGFNATLEQYDSFAEHFAKLGYLVYSFDFFGGSPRTKSGGQDMLDMSVTTELHDLAQVVDQLTAEPFVDASQISLMGTSQGGVVTSLYAADHPERVHQLLLIFPAFVLFDDVKDTYKRLGSPALDAIPEKVTHHNATLGSIYIKDALAIDITEKQKAIAVPTIIVHGTADTIAPYHYAEEAKQTIPDATLVTVEGRGHRIDPHFEEVALEAFTKFLKK